LQPALLQQSEQIMHLVADLKRIAACRRDAPLRSQEATALEKEIDRQLARWKPDWDRRFLQRFALGQAELKRVREMAARLNRLEREQSEAEGAHRAQRQQLADGRARLQQLIAPPIQSVTNAPNQDAPSQGQPTNQELYASRAAREQKWAEIKAIIANIKPEALSAQQLNDYELLVARCDELADGLRSADAAAAAREEQARRQQLEQLLIASQHELDKLDQQLTRLKKQREQWQLQWCELLIAWQLPDQWTPQIADEVLSELFELKERLNRADNLHQRVDDMQKEIEQFALTTRQVCEVVASDLLTAEPDAAVRSLYQRMEQVKAAEQLARELDSELARVDEQLSKSERRREELLSKLVVLPKNAMSQLPSWQSKLRQANELWNELQRLDQLLSSLSENVGDPSGQESGDKAIDLSVECQRVRTALGQAETEHQKFLKQSVLLGKRLEDLDSQDRTNQLALELEQHRAELQSAVDEWVPLTMASTLMAQCLEKFERERQPQLLQFASNLFQEMTEGRYLEIRRRLGEAESLVVKHRDGRDKVPAELSRGTREQLYLAIRLAYVMQYCEQAEPLPLVMDDVLVNFDARRARATIEVLQRVSRDVQILFMTCHEATARMMIDVLPFATRIDLAEPLGEVEQRPAAKIPPRKRVRLAPATAEKDLQRPLFPPQ